ncbi:hypothetical protein [Oligoflexus tunisiensis]|uniref:hypothetical protein n=1 Tax=Oligoflexus tunisiensis TaxID=708132 RepID=UPI001C40316C|nr:hypothetical protein [Oligoflexus tunisiensis]
MAAFGQDSGGAPSHETLRSNLKYSITAGVGIRTGNFLEGTLAASYFLQPKSVVTISLMNLTGSINEKADRDVDGHDLYFVGVTTELKGSAIAASYKEFFTDSFYVEGGLDLAKVNGEFRISKDILSSAENLTSDLGHYTKLSMMVQIGNQWQWENFTLGTSWLGYLQPISTSESYTDPTSFSETSNSARTFRDEAKQPQTTLLRFYLGWSF